MIKLDLIWPPARRLGRFLVVGAGNFVLDFTIYFALTRGVPGGREFYLLANAASFFVANLSSYLVNGQWTFGQGSNRTLKQYGRFLAVSLIYLGVMELSLWGLVGGWTWPDLPAKFLVNGTAAVIYFTILNLWVFRPNLAVSGQLNDNQTLDQSQFEKKL